jgi:hypothetical protein
MAWKAKLLSVDNTINVQYYETISGDIINERYPLDQFSSKAEVVAYAQNIVNDLNSRLAKTGQLATLLSSSINKDIAT